MNKKPELEELFEAARRREADIRRQQKLAEMIDQLAAAEAPRRKRPIWAAVGIAASILLLVAVGLRALYGGVEGTGNGPVVAETRPVQPGIVPDTVLTDSQVVETAPAYVAPNQNDVLAETVPSLKPVEQPAEIKGVESESTTHPTLGTPLQEGTAAQTKESLLAEESTVQTKIQSNSIKVHERTSSRLVCGSGCKPALQRNTDNGNAPVFAVINNEGASTSFELGSIEF